MVRRLAALALAAIALAACKRDPKGAEASASARPSAQPPGFDTPMPRPDAAIPRVPVAELPPMGAFVSLALAPAGATVDNEPVVGAWPEKERTRVLGLLPAGTDAVLVPRRKVLGLSNWSPLEGVDGGLADALLPLRDALGRLSMIEIVHRGDAARGAPPKLDLAVYAAQTISYDLFTRVLMTAHSTGWLAFHVAVRDPGGEVKDLPITAPANDVEGLRRLSGAYCSVPVVTLGTFGAEVSVGLGVVGADVVAQALPHDLKRIEAERAFEERGGDPHADHLALPAGSAAPDGGTPEPGWARWYRKVVVREDRACPSVPARGGQTDVEGLVSLAREVLDVAPGCRAVYLRAAPDASLAVVSPVAAALARVAPTLVLLAPGTARTDCSEAASIADLRKRAP
jgi:hypothetical protein